MSSCRPDERISFTLSELSRERQTPRRRAQVDEEFAVRSAAAVAGYDSEAAIRDEEAALRVEARKPPPKLKSRSCCSAISACFVAIWGIGCAFTFFTLILLQISNSSGAPGASGASGMSGMSGVSGASGASGASGGSHFFWPWDDASGTSNSGPSQHRLARDTTIKDHLEFGLWDSKQQVTKLQLQVAVSLALGVRAEDDDVAVKVNENHFFEVAVQHATVEEEDFVSSTEFLQRLNNHVGVYGGEVVISKPPKLVKFVQ